MAKRSFAQRGRANDSYAESAIRVVEANYQAKNDQEVLFSEVDTTITLPPNPSNWQRVEIIAKTGTTATVSGGAHAIAGPASVTSDTGTWFIFTPEEKWVVDSGSAVATSEVGFDTQAHAGGGVENIGLSGKIWTLGTRIGIFVRNNAGLDFGGATAPVGESFLNFPAASLATPLRTFMTAYSAITPGALAGIMSWDNVDFLHLGDDGRVQAVWLHSVQGFVVPVSGVDRFHVRAGDAGFTDVEIRLTSDHAIAWGPVDGVFNRMKIVGNTTTRTTDLVSSDTVRWTSTDANLGLATYGRSVYDQAPGPDIQVADVTLDPAMDGYTILIVAQVIARDRTTQNSYSQTVLQELQFDNGPNTYSIVGNAGGDTANPFPEAVDIAATITLTDNTNARVIVTFTPITGNNYDAAVHVQAQRLKIAF